MQRALVGLGTKQLENSPSLFVLLDAGKQGTPGCHKAWGCPHHSGEGWTKGPSAQGQGGGAGP